MVLEGFWGGGATGVRGRAMAAGSGSDPLNSKKTPNTPGTWQWTSTSTRARASTSTRAWARKQDKWTGLPTHAVAPSAVADFDNPSIIYALHQLGYPIGPTGPLDILAGIWFESSPSLANIEGLAIPTTEPVDGVLWQQA